MNPKVWQASGHVTAFNDPMVECKNCHERFRADQIDINAPCPNCKKSDFTDIKQFNMMFETNLGPVKDENSKVYLRPETAQGMFVNFKNVLDTSRKSVPFGIAQIGPAFRNEITPGNFIFRTREFEQMEIEYFVHPSEWEKWFEYWLEEQKQWLKEVGIEKEAVFVEIAEADRAHYSKRSVDTEYKFPFGQKELYGLAYRSDYDLSQHQKMSGQSLEYTDPHTNEKFLPLVIEPTWGVNRTLLAVLCSAYREEEDRVYLKLPAKIAPYKVAVFPLLKNKPELVEKARGIFKDLQNHFSVAWDERGNVGKRYYSQDEIGTPYCITVDFDTLENGTVTVRNRDTKEQPRVKIEELSNYLQTQIYGRV
jgi:glycyl-tRNA synthetase